MRIAAVELRALYHCGTTNHQLLEDIISQASRANVEFVSLIRLVYRAKRMTYLTGRPLKVPTAANHLAIKSVQGHSRVSRLSSDSEVRGGQEPRGCIRHM